MPWHLVADSNDSAQQFDETVDAVSCIRHAVDHVALEVIEPIRNVERVVPASHAIVSRRIEPLEGDGLGQFDAFEKFRDPAIGAATHDVVELGIEAVGAFGERMAVAAEMFVRLEYTDFAP